MQSSMGRALCNLFSTKEYCGVLCASFVVQSSAVGSTLCKILVQSSTGKYFVQAL